MLDLPPLIPVVDGVYLAGYSDCTVMVVLWGATSQSTVKQAIRILQSGARPDTPILPVLNLQEGPRDRNRGKYSYYYGTEE